MAKAKPSKPAAGKSPASASDGDRQTVSVDEVMRRLAALETQVHAFHRQTDVQLNALLSSIRKTMAVLHGQTEITAIHDRPAPAIPSLPSPAPAVPATPAPAAPPAPVASAAPAPAGGNGSIKVIAVGHGETTAIPASQDPNDLPHLLSDASVSRVMTRPAPAEPAEAPPVGDAPEIEVKVAPLAKAAAKPSPSSTGRVMPPPVRPVAAPPPLPQDPEAEDTGSATLAGLNAADLKRLLERKAQQLAESQRDGASGKADMETRSLTLSFEELEELRGGSAGDQDSATPPPDNEAVTPDPEAVAGNMPYPPEVQDTKKSMFALKHVAQELMENPVIPGTNDLISVEMRNELSWYSRLILENFLTMHEKHKNRAMERYASLARYDSNLTDPTLFWDRDAIRDYEDYRSITFIEKYLDQLEREIIDSGDRRYYKLLDYLAEITGLQRIPVEIGYEQYDAARHQYGSRQPPLSSLPPEGRVVTELMQSGYEDTHTGNIARKAIVIVGVPQADPFEELFGDIEVDPELSDDLDDTADIAVSLDGDDDEESWQPVFHTPDPDSAPHGATVRGIPRSPIASYIEHEPIGEVPFPEEVVHCQNLVYNLRMSVTNINQLGQLPRSGELLDDEIAEIMTHVSNSFFKDFTLLHKANQEKAQQRFQSIASREADPYDPTLYWDEAAVEAYHRLRTHRFVEVFLDPLEARIIGKRLPGHGELLDQFALDMEMSRIGIFPGVTMFDANRHELPPNTSVPANADLRKIPIHAVIKSGYTDLTTGSLARRAVVTVKLHPFRRSM